MNTSAWIELKLWLPNVQLLDGFTFFQQTKYEISCILALQEIKDTF